MMMYTFGTVHLCKGLSNVMRLQNQFYVTQNSDDKIVCRRQIFWRVFVTKQWGIKYLILLYWNFIPTQYFRSALLLHLHYLCDNKISSSLSPYIKHDRQVTNRIPSKYLIPVWLV